MANVVMKSLEAIYTLWFIPSLTIKFIILNFDPLDIYRIGFLSDMCLLMKIINAEGTDSQLQWYSQIRYDSLLSRSTTGCVISRV